MDSPLGGQIPGTTQDPNEARTGIKNQNQTHNGFKSRPAGTKNKPAGIKGLGPGGLVRAHTHGIPIHKVVVEASGEDNILGKPARMVVRRRTIGVDIRKSQFPS